MMRIIAGTARGTRLSAPAGTSTRPTTDRLKENLFNILSPLIADARFLDLFSGSGAIGIEALSRGARIAVFVEQSRKAAQVIKENLTKAKLEDRAEIIVMPVKQAINRLNDSRYSFDIIFMDPPYESNYVDDVILQLSAARLLAPEGIIAAELPLRLTPAGNEVFNVTRVKEYGDKKFIIWSGSL
jgi:16S rRNA (guanine(966)-N(2))-methyltransferase RsmD